MLKAFGNRYHLYQFLSEFIEQIGDSATEDSGSETDLGLVCSDMITHAPTISKSAADPGVLIDHPNGLLSAAPTRLMTGGFGLCFGRGMSNPRERAQRRPYKF